MEKKLRKYANLLLDKCLNIENDGLYICIDPEAYQFAYILYEEALKKNIKNIDLDFRSSRMRKSLIENVDIDELYKNDYFDRSKLDLYTKNNYAFLFLVSYEFIEIDKKFKEKELELDKYSKKTCSYFRKLEGDMSISWCIAAVATNTWANKLFKGETNAYQKLWNTIFDICYINYDNPNVMWEKEIEKSKKRCEKLNNLRIKKLKYKNSLGTDFSVELSKEALFIGIDDKLRGEDNIIVNMPSFEVFTSPIMDSANGIIYSSKPLVYSGKTIEDFYLKFENGKVIEYDAKKGKDTLDNILNTDDGAKRLGEVALVEYSSPISKTNICFYETLYDENSSCHLALGESFPFTIKGFNPYNVNEYENKKLNKSLTHVDFMIGTKDLEITATTYDNKIIKIFDKGNFVI